MSKRGHHEGSIVKRKDGRWHGAVTIGKNPDGSQKRKYVYGKTRNEVATKINELLHSINIGTYIDRDTSPTVAQWLDTWLYSYKKNSVKERTFDQYECIIRVRLNPAIGDIKLVDLKEDKLQDLYNTLYANGLSARTVQLINTVLHTALKKAVKCGLIIRNVCEAVELPRQSKKERRVLSPEEQEMLIKEQRIIL